jgi:hypothetical protein
VFSRQLASVTVAVAALASLATGVVAGFHIKALNANGTFSCNGGSGGTPTRDHVDITSGVDPDKGNERVLSARVWFSWDRAGASVDGWLYQTDGNGKCLSQAPITGKVGPGGGYSADAGGEVAITPGAKEAFVQVTLSTGLQEITALAPLDLTRPRLAGARARGIRR